jgi:predicted RecB family nuclease
MKDNRTLNAILALGKKFEEEVVEEKGIKELESLRELGQVKETEVVLKTPQLFKNNKLGIVGIPDLIDMSMGALYPVEIKLHNSVRKTDLIELGFYWRLLEPLRTKKSKPMGFVLLGTGETKQVELPLDILEMVDFYIQSVRDAKTNGAQPSLSKECKSCTLAKECSDVLSKKGDLSLIYNLKAVRKQQFMQLGITNISDLTKTDALFLHQDLVKRFGVSPGFDEIRRMQAHGFSIIAKKPIFFGQRDRCGIFNKHKLIIDLEYDPNSLIWLSGALVDDQDGTNSVQFFSENNTKANERKILNSLRKFISKYPKYPIMTYGAAADIPQLKKAWARHRFPDAELQAILERHYDINAFLRNGFRFPLHNMGLKDIGSYLGFKRRFDMDGLMALIEYFEYLNTKKLGKKEAIKGRLLRYNLEDLKCTQFVANQVDNILNTCIDASEKTIS